MKLRKWLKKIMPHPFRNRDRDEDSRTEDRTEEPEERAATGGDWRNPRDGGTYTITGTQQGGVKWSGKRNVTLKGTGNATIKGGTLAALDLRNCTGCTFEGITFTGARQNGVYAEKGSNLTFRRCKFLKNREKSGGLFHDIAGVTWEDCEAAENGEHGFYGSGGGAGNLILRRSKFTKNSRCAIQFNPEGGDGVITGGRIEGCTMTGNANSQGAALNLGAWVDGALLDCTVEGNKKGVVFWKGDGRQGCRNVRVERNKLQDVRVIDGSKEIRFSGNTAPKPAAGGWTSDGTNRSGAARW